MKISIKSMETSHGHERFMVETRLGSRRTRVYCPTLVEARATARKLEKDVKRFGDSFARLSDVDRAELVLAMERAKAGGFRVCDAVELYASLPANAGRAASMLTLGQAVDSCLTDKKNMGLRQRSLSALGSTLNRFRMLGEAKPLGEVERAHVKGWLMRGTSPSGALWSTRTRNGYLTDLNTFFNWAVGENHLEASPITGLRRFRPSRAEEEAAEERRKTLSNEEAARTLRRCAADAPELVAHVALGWFAGLRPERECVGMRWADVLMDERLVHVRRSIAKSRQDRYIPMVPVLHEWMEWATAHSVPLPASSFLERWEVVRRACGLWKEDWPADGTRHTFASNHLAVYGTDATKEALGHGNHEMLFKHYRVLVKRAEAEEFFGLSPAKLGC